MKLCLDCTEYSCGAQGSYNISAICGDKEDKKTMQVDSVLNSILEEIDRLRDALMSTRVPLNVAIQYKNTAYGLDYAECIIMKYKKEYEEKKED